MKRPKVIFKWYELDVFKDGKWKPKYSQEFDTKKEAMKELRLLCCADGDKARIIEGVTTNQVIIHKNI